MAGGAGDRLRGEVVKGESARHWGPQRQRLDHHVMPGGGEVRAGLAGAVGRVGEHLDRCWFLGEQPRSDDRVMGVCAGCLGEYAVGDDPGVRLDRDVGFEPVPAPRYTVE